MVLRIARGISGNVLVVSTPLNVLVYGSDEGKNLSGPLAHQGDSPPTALRKPLLSVYCVLLREHLANFRSIGVSAFNLLRFPLRGPAPEDVIDIQDS